MELVAPVNLNMVCFRYYLDGVGEDELAKRARPDAPVWTKQSIKLAVKKRIELKW